MSVFNLESVTVRQKSYSIKISIFFKLGLFSGILGENSPYFHLEMELNLTPKTPL